LVSELLLLMLEGLSGKTQRSLDNIYENKDESFPEETQARKRLQEVMDAIDDLCGSQMPGLVYSRVAMFHTLFTFLYSVMFGLGSPLNHEPAKRLRKGLASRLAEASRLIGEGQIPEDLSKALRGATSHKDSRSTRLKFVRRVCLDAAT